MFNTGFKHNAFRALGYAQGSVHAVSQDFDFTVAGEEFHCDPLAAEFQTLVKQSQAGRAEDYS